MLFCFFLNKMLTISIGAPIALGFYDSHDVWNMMPNIPQVLCSLKFRKKRNFPTDSSPLVTDGNGLN